MALPKFLQSSQNAQALSLTIKGILVGLIPVALILLKAFNPEGEVVPDDLQLIATNIGDSIIVLFTLVSSVTTFYGVVRKFLPKKKEFKDLEK